MMVTVMATAMTTTTTVTGQRNSGENDDTQGMVKVTAEMTQKK